MVPEPEAVTEDLGRSANAVSTQIYLETMEATKDAGACNGNTAEIDYNPGLERVMPDGAHEDDITIEDEITATNIAAGDGSKKKKKSKPKSQRAAVKPIPCHVCSISCLLTHVVGEESRHWV